MKTEGIDQPVAQEMSVPVTLEDFDADDRVWYYSSTKLSRVFGKVVSINQVDSNMAFRSDDGAYAIIADDWGKGTSGYPPVSEFRKSLDVASLSIGDRISRSADWEDGIRSRVYAVVSSVVPGQSLGIILEKGKGSHVMNARKAPEEHLIKEQKNGHTIEYQLADWELEA